MKILINASLAVTAVIACLLLAEIGLRIFTSSESRAPVDYYEKSPIPGLPYVTKPNINDRDFRTNSHRLRDSEIPLEKPPGTLRIAMVGNSMTIGHAVKQDELYTEVMERDLNSRFQGQPKVDVLNAGEQGYSIIHFMPFAKEFVYPYQPDYVIYQFCWNDIESSSLMRVRNVPDQLPESGPIRFLARRSRLFGKLMKLRDMSKFAQNLLVMYDDSLAVEGFFKDLFAWADSVRDQEMLFGMAIFPNVLEVQVPDKYPELTAAFLKKKDQIIERCRRGGIPVCDLTEPLMKRYAGDHQDLYADYGHFNPRGHALAAKVIEDWLIPTLKEAKLLPD